MNRKKAILMASSAVLIAAVAAFIVIRHNNKNSEPLKELTSSEIAQRIINNVKITTTEKTVEFKSLDEAKEYIKKANSIQDISEAENFFKEFFESSSENKPEYIVGYFAPEVREEFIAKRLFPVFDATETFTFDIDNIKVSENAIGSYGVTYDLYLIGKDNSPKFLFKCSDSYELIKRNNAIYVASFSHKVTEKNMIKI